MSGANERAAAWDAHKATQALGAIAKQLYIANLIAIGYTNDAERLMFEVTE